MTVSALNTKHVYNCNGVQTAWPYTFPILATTDIKVYITSATSVTTEINSNFEVDTDNGNVIYPTVESGLNPAVVVPTGAKITIKREVPLTQEIDLVNEGALNAETLEQGYDKNVMMMQQMKETLERCVKYGVSETPADDTSNTFLSAIEAAKAQVDASRDTAVAAAATATDQAATASDHANTASNQATAATTQAGNAAASATLAQTWAIKTDGPVAGGEYSTKYHAQASASSAGDAQAAQTAAESAQSAAEAAQSAAEGAASTATTQAGIATTQAGNAATEAGNAQTSASNAAASESKAADWAEKPEDSEVESGKYSALHWAAKAQDAADVAVTAINGDNSTDDLYSFIRTTDAYMPVTKEVVPANVRRLCPSFGGFGRALLVEKAVTNLLTSAEAAELSGATTKTVSNGGKYSVSIYGTNGSIALSGATTGTVTPGNPFSFTAGTTSLTLTPSQTNGEWPKLVMVELSDRPTTYHPTSRGADIAKMDLSMLKPTAGSIELIAYLGADTKAVTTLARYIFDVMGDGGWTTIALYHKAGAAYWTLFTKGDDGISTGSVDIADSLTPDGWYRIQVTFNATAATVKFWLLETGMKVAERTINNPPMSAGMATMNIGCNISLNSGYYLNTYFDDIRISNIVRDESEKGVLRPLMYDSHTIRKLTFDNDDTTIANKMVATVDYVGAHAQWKKYTIDYTTVQTEALTKEVGFTTLLEGEVLLGVKIKHSVAFAGTSITAVNVSVGINGSTTKYASAFDVLQAVANDTFQLSQGFFEENHIGGTSIVAKFTAVGANLSALTAGSVDIWLLLAKAY